MKDLKTIIFPIIFGLPVLVIIFAFSLYFFGCGTNNTCAGIPISLTPIPTLVPATLPAPKVGAAAAAAIPRCQVAALDLIGAWVSAGYPETASFAFTDAKNQVCSATFKGDVQQLFVTPNLWFDGAPACITCHNADLAKAIKNMDLSSYAGILAGSNRVGGAAKGNDILGGGNWDKALLHQMLYAPNGKTLIGRPAMPFGRPATVPASGPVISAGSPTGQESAATPTAAAVPTPTAAAPGIARPSNPGGAGLAITLTGDPASGAQIFAANCVPCHGPQGKGDVQNPGSADGTVPALRPIDETMANDNLLVFAYNIDLFVEHGSTPAGTTPAKSMPAWGDAGTLSPQQIADVIAYLISLNK